MSFYTVLENLKAAQKDIEKLTCLSTINNQIQTLIDTLYEIDKTISFDKAGYNLKLLARQITHCDIIIKQLEEEKRNKTFSKSKLTPAIKQLRRARDELFEIHKKA